MIMDLNFKNNFIKSKRNIMDHKQNTCHVYLIFSIFMGPYDTIKNMQFRLKHIIMHLKFHKKALVLYKNVLI